MQATKQVEPTPDAKSLALRVGQDDYTATSIPSAVRVITAGVDVISDRFVIHVVGWGANQECWVLGYEVILIPTDHYLNWFYLDTALDKPYTNTHGDLLNISQTFIESGGHMTAMVYRYCNDYVSKRRFATKGFTGKRPFFSLSTFSTSGHPKLKLYLIGIECITERIYRQLNQTKQGGGYIHFPSTELPDGYFDQLTSQEFRVRVCDGVEKSYCWSRASVSSQALETFALAYAALSKHYQGKPQQTAIEAPVTFPADKSSAVGKLFQRLGDFSHRLFAQRADCNVPSVSVNGDSNG